MTNLPTRRQWQAIDRRLAGVHGPKVGHDRRGDPLDALVGTILSQSTNDVLSGRAYDALKARFPTWEEALRAPTNEIAAAIERGGLSKAKARRIKAILEELVVERGELSLDFLQTYSPAETVAYLTHFEGVGPKTAACVLLFALDQPVFPVDTHIHRIARRMGWVADRDPAERTHQVLDAAIPDELKHQLHVNLIAHGRSVCAARGPRCGECVVRRYCAFGREAEEQRGEVPMVSGEESLPAPPTVRQRPSGTCEEDGKGFLALQDRHLRFARHPILPSARSPKAPHQFPHHPPMARVRKLPAPLHRQPVKAAEVLAAFLRVRRDLALPPEDNVEVNEHQSRRRPERVEAGERREPLVVQQHGVQLFLHLAEQGGCGWVGLREVFGVEGPAGQHVHAGVHVV